MFECVAPSTDARVEFKVGERDHCFFLNLRYYTIAVDSVYVSPEVISQEKECCAHTVTVQSWYSNVYVVVSDGE